LAGAQALIPRMMNALRTSAIEKFAFLFFVSIITRITYAHKLNGMAIEVTLNELADVIARGGFVLDVREDYEWEEGHVPNAHHIPMNDVANQLDKLDDGARIFVVCKSGRRSMTVANFLESQGYDVVSVAGGTDGWAESGRELSFEASL